MIKDVKFIISRNSRACESGSETLQLGRKYKHSSVLSIAEAVPTAHLPDTWLKTQSNAHHKLWTATVCESSAISCHLLWNGRFYMWPSFSWCNLAHGSGFSIKSDLKPVYKAPNHNEKNQQNVS